jgi:hypothetical protein
MCVAGCYQRGKNMKYQVVLQDKAGNGELWIEKETKKEAISYARILSKKMPKNKIFVETLINDEHEIIWTSKNWDC